MIRATKIENVSCEEQAKFLHERLLGTEEWLSKFFSAFSLYTKKTARLRDTADEIATILNEFATNERINRTTKSQILIFSELLASLNDIRDNKIHHLQAELLTPLCQYNVLCGNAKAEVKSIFSKKEKETHKRKQLGKLRSVSPYNREQIIKAEAALSTALSDISQAQRELEEHMIMFEKKKIDDLKAFLLQYVSLELAEYTTGVEILTRSYNELSRINVKNDVKDFVEVLKKNPMSLRLMKVKNMSVKQNELANNCSRTPDSVIMEEEEEEMSHSSEESTSERSQTSTEKNIM